MATKAVTNNIDPEEFKHYSEEEIFSAWSFVVMSIDFALNSPQSILVPEDVRFSLEIAKKKIEFLMNVYSEDVIEEKENRV